MCAIKPSLPVRDSEAAPARPTSSRTLGDLLDALQSSFVLDGVDEYLERVLGWGASPLSPAETRTIAPRLYGSLWWLVTEILRRVNGRPDGAQKELIGRAVRLREDETADEVGVRRLAVLVSALLDEIADDDAHGPLPYFGDERDVRWSA
ncbi:DUF6415 family natural product biosynthesis protein [Streptomyces acidiscabies]|uniref:DUF6415 family natural product biosynthesis protein n=1 Tax=Streptomyces acidiscabies TaxID=42234 RepID=A0AAP6B5K7_9ACTN|nr:DUF6415 family natural product biosynthesis protein [Streptomyces acidiscabies]MBP5941697.1 hypothetical protein [Streptomyces sp. LBUM 1476]MBZ3913104.1 hypothetical protein [Streptomyces acidiscabies]MDX2958591.1 DUF6415 family natural product biosynthesis protein [Streptomyces acidiscabies]MDX3020903.1 DUF6415 family natural product biosynthesis protein [Streptomyces acidiscabies]MDX3790068.1 DUF6415 family natural product biosynthesis protein [Streptomyces acidiscabies]